jgi:HAD superfamily hydrolase (TIGR01549 family)
VIRGLPPALLLDLDDTILRYGAGGEGLWREMLAPHARALGFAVAVMEATVGEVAGPYWSDPEQARAGRLDMRAARRTIVAGAFERLGIDDPERSVFLADAFTWEREARMEPLPGALEAVDRLRDEGHRLALVTNGGPVFQRAKLARFGLEGHFDAVFVEGELGYGKPDPRVFLAALDAVAAGADDAWMVGDNLSADIAGAQAVGIHAIWVDHRGEGPPAGAPSRPDRVVAGLAELLES